MKTEMLKFERIRNLRVDNDLTQQKVADYLHVKQKKDKISGITIEGGYPATA